jgi:cardiolipin synthase
MSFDVQTDRRSAQVRRLRVPRQGATPPTGELPGRFCRQGAGAQIVTPPQYALAHALTRSLGQPLVSGNRVELLRGGEPAWAALFDAIDRAREHVNIESAAFVAPAALAAALAQRLIVRAGLGVRVNLLLDSSRPGAARDTALLRAAGIGVCESRWLPRLKAAVLDRLSAQQTRRSLIVIDGRVAFIGGLVPLRPARADGCLRVEGPVVARLQSLFVAHWRRECGTAPPPANYFPALVPRGPQRAALAACEAGWQPKPSQPALLAAIDAAQNTVLLAGTLSAPLADALCRAAARGVAVQVMLPPDSDGRDRHRHAGNAAHAALLGAGVRLHRRHSAAQADACVIDGVWAALGGAIDAGHRVHDAELTLIVLDGELGGRVERRLREELALGRELTARTAAPQPGATRPFA